MGADKRDTEVSFTVTKKGLFIGIGVFLFVALVAIGLVGGIFKSVHQQAVADKEYKENGDKLKAWTQKKLQEQEKIKLDPWSDERAAINRETGIVYFKNGYQYDTEENAYVESSVMNLNDQMDALSVNKKSKFYGKDNTISHLWGYEVINDQGKRTDTYVNYMCMDGSIYKEIVVGKGLQFSTPFDLWTDTKKPCSDKIFMEPSTMVKYASNTPKKEVKMDIYNDGVAYYDIEQNTVTIFRSNATYPIRTFLPSVQGIENFKTNYIFVTQEEASPYFGKSVYYLWGYTDNNIHTAYMCLNGKVFVDNVRDKDLEYKKSFLEWRPTGANCPIEQEVFPS